MDINPTVAHHEVKLNFPIAVEHRIHSLDARQTVPATLFELEFLSKPPDDRRFKARFSDAMQINRFTPGGGMFWGFETVVSESARDKLMPYLLDECSFVPVKIADAPQPYYILWIHKIYDALDHTRSRLGNDTTFPGRKIPYRAVFHLDQIGANYLFRVPLWKYSMDCDLALMPFRELVHRLKITGFVFQAGGDYGPFLK